MLGHPDPGAGPSEEVGNLVRGEAGYETEQDDLGLLLGAGPPEEVDRLGGTEAVQSEILWQRPGIAAVVVGLFDGLRARSAGLGPEAIDGPPSGCGEEERPRSVEAAGELGTLLDESQPGLLGYVLGVGADEAPGVAKETRLEPLEQGGEGLALPALDRGPEGVVGGRSDVVGHGQIFGSFGVQGEGHLGPTRYQGSFGSACRHREGVVALAEAPSRDLP